MVTRSRPQAYRSGIAFAALLVASMSVSDHRVAAALHNGLSNVSGIATESTQPARLTKVGFGVVSPNIFHEHY